MRLPGIEPCPACGVLEACRCLLPPKDHPHYPHWEKQLAWEEIASPAKKSEPL